MRILFFLFVCIILSSCFNKVYKDNFFAKPYRIGSERKTGLNLNGAYYNIEGKDKRLSVFFLYGNCIQRTTTFDTNHYKKSTLVQNINDMVEKFKNSDENNQGFEDGGYQVINSEITIQGLRYIPQGAWGTVTYKGRVVNDSTMLITKFEHSKREIFRQENLYFYFIPVNKPDSLKGNRWKEKKWFWKD